MGKCTSRHVFVAVISELGFLFCSRCDQECRDGTYGPGCVRSCLCHNKAVCSKADGTCNCTEPGVTGVLCDMPCPGGTYGLNCAQSCSCRHGASCDRFNGKLNHRCQWTFNERSALIFYLSVRSRRIIVNYSF